MNEKMIYLCSVCYLNKGIILNSCGCFYCSDCFKDSKSYINIDNAKCISCNKAINFNKAIDITNKESLGKISFIYDDPELHLKKIIDSIKFQKLHQKKYIQFLEKTVAELTKENTRLKESFLKGKVEPSFNPSLKKLGGGESIPPGQIIDIKQIKKIEPKIKEKISNKCASKIANPNTLYGDYPNISTLNAKTAEVLKTSPAIMVAGHHNLPPANQMGTRPLISVNINNSNKAVKEDISNYEKSLFKQSGGGINIQSSLQNDGTCKQQKRSYNQMINYENTSRVIPNNFTYQTPIPSSSLPSFNEFQIKPKQFKYN